MAVREALWLHLAFCVIAAASLYFAPASRHGWTLLWLVAGYHLAVPAWSLIRSHTEWLVLWLYLLPLSVAMVLPDWALVRIVGTLHFPDHGQWRIGGTVPLMFMGTWTMVLLPLVLVAQSSRLPYLTLTLASLVVFAVSEWAARSLHLWYVQNVWTFYGVAIYALLPKVLLATVVLHAYRSQRGAAVFDRIVIAAGISIFYTGAMVLSLLLTRYLFSAG